MFSIERLQKEFEYIAEKASNQKNTILHIADVNFGMFPRDKQICKMLFDLKNKYSWPLNICGTTGKNNKERIIIIVFAPTLNRSISQNITKIEYY